MAEIVWRLRAARHLEQIYKYIYLRNPEAAERYATGLREVCAALSQFPERARRYDHRYRVLVFRNHLVIYRYDRERERVYITGIFDGRQDVERIEKALRKEDFGDDH